MTYLKAKKTLGQHFLKSASALNKIIEAAEIKSDERVLEIGPGTGILTAELLKHAKKVVAVEKDDRAFQLLQEKFTKEISSGSLDLVHGDILMIDPQNLITKDLTEGNYSIVANIPYYITGAILRKFLEKSPRPNKMILLVQKEVALRMIGRKSDDSNQGKSSANKESLLSISVKAFGVPKIIATVPRGAFVPPPSVDSAIISIENISSGQFKKDVEIARFFDILHAGFAHKRKLLIRNLEPITDRSKLLNIWLKIGLDEKIRPEDISLESWIKIVQEINAA